MSQAQGRKGTNSFGKTRDGEAVMPGEAGGHGDWDKWKEGDKGKPVLKGKGFKGSQGMTELLNLGLGLGLW